MTTLEQANKNALRIVSQEIDRDEKKDRKTGKIWNGRKIIQLKEWENIRNQGQNEELKFIPDDYSHLLFFDHPDNEKIIDERERWWKDYHDYLVSTKNSKYGIERCKQCALHGENRTSSKIVKDILLEHSLHIKVTDPCTIGNSMECPHPDEMEDLFTIKRIWEILDRVLWYAVSPRMESAWVDFKVQKADSYEYMSYHGGSLRYSVDEYLEKANRPFIRIRKIKDIYDVLIDSEKFRQVMNQYIDSIEDEWQKGVTPESKKTADAIRVLIEPLVDFFSNISGKLRLEEFRGLYGQTFEDEEKRRLEDAERAKSRSDEPMERKHHFCKHCLDDGVFYCANCHIRICQGHFAEHRKFHMLEENQGF